MYLNYLDNYYYHLDSNNGPRASFGKKCPGCEHRSGAHFIDRSPPRPVKKMNVQKTPEKREVVDLSAAADSIGDDENMNELLDDDADDSDCALVVGERLKWKIQSCHQGNSFFFHIPNDDSIYQKMNNKCIETLQANNSLPIELNEQLNCHRNAINIILSNY